MLEDRDLFPITCPRCRQQTHKEIGRLKSEGRIVCSECGMRMHFNRDEFIRTIDKAKEVLTDGAWGIRPSED